MAEVLPTVLDPRCVRVLEGGVPETTALLEQRFDHIFYTGNGAVGRVVMAAAARHLTPVTLELGGKNPCIVHRDADLDVAARRIAWGKFFNAGQTCVAPDHVLVDREVHDAFLERLCTAVRSFYGEDPRSSPDLARIVNLRHHRRLVHLLQGQRVVMGGRHDEAELYLEPTVLRDVDPASAVMDEEIFGPILPVLAVDGVDDAIRRIRERPKPLALYVFTRDRAAADRVLARTRSGSAVVNHIWIHLMVRSLPFGGVGESGMGAYHGRDTFETFCHRKSVLWQGTTLDPRVVYPPYDESRIPWLRRLF